MSAASSTTFINDPLLDISSSILQSCDCKLIQWQGEDIQADYHLSLIQNSVDPASIVKLLNVLVTLGCEVSLIERLSASEQSELHATEISLNVASNSIEDIRNRLRGVAEEFNCEISIRPSAHKISHFGLACFDMDSTLIKVEVIDELAKLAGVGGQVSEITERAMQGELDFNQSFSARMALLNGLDAAVVEEVKQGLPIMDGAPNLLANLNHLGIKTAIFSGGFVPFAEHLQSLYGFSVVHANTLDIDNQKLSGVVIPPVINAHLKAQLLSKTANSLGLEEHQCIAVGDGANDLKMLDLAGFGVAFRAKPVVRAAAEYSIRQAGLDSILYMLGLREDDWV